MLPHATTRQTGPARAFHESHGHHLTPTQDALSSTGPPTRKGAKTAVMYSSLGAEHGIEFDSLRIERSQAEH